MSEVSVNGVTIDAHTIGLEAQYHPAPHWEAAQHEATRALVVRQLLLQQARSEGMVALREDDEALEQQAIEQLTQRDVAVPEVNEATCRAYYERNPQRFTSPDLFEASHILFAVPADDAQGAADARRRAQDTLQLLRKKPEAFVRLARERSGCPSAQQAGSLGQLTRGETLPEFEAVLDTLQDGEIAAELLETEHGFHIIRLDHHVRGERAPFDAVRSRIQIYLRDAAWRKRLRQYIARLAANSNIEGFDLDSEPPQAPVVLREVPKQQGCGSDAGGGCGCSTQDESSQKSPVRLRVL